VAPGGVAGGRTRRCLSLSLALALLLTGAVSSRAGAGAGWPMAGGGPARAHCTAGLAPGLCECWRTYAGTTGSAPISDGRSVYVALSRGAVLALNGEDGLVDWRFEAPPRLGASAALAADALFAAAYDGVLYALGRTTGWLRWQYAGSSWVAAPPLVVDDTVLFATYGGSVHALATSSGEPRWVQSCGYDFVEAAPAASADALYVATTRGRLLSYALPGGQVRWERSLGRFRAGPVFARADGDTGGRVLAMVAGPAGLQELHCLDAASGRELWRSPLPGAGCAPGMAVRDDVVYCVAGGGVSARALDDGRPLWRFPAPGVAAAGRALPLAPVAAGGLLIITVARPDGEADLVFLNRGGGTFLWSVPLSTAPMAGPAVCGERLVFAGEDGTVFALGPLGVEVNGVVPNFSAAWPSMADGVALVPLRPLCTALGATVDWDAEREWAVVEYRRRQVVALARPESPESTAPGADTSESGATVVVCPRVGGSLIAPARELATALGLRITWDPRRRTVVIGDPASSPARGATS